MVYKRHQILKNIDWLSVFLVFALIVFGIINIYSTVYDEESAGSILDLSTRYGKQILWAAISIPIIFTIFIIDSKFYSVFSYIFYGIGILLLIAVLIWGIEVNATKAWFDFGSFRVQPSEFVKFMLALAIAQYISFQNFSFNKYSSVIKLLVLFSVPTFLVFLQKDIGTTFVFFSFILVFYREGLNSNLFFTSFAIIALFILALVINLSFLLLISGLLVFTLMLINGWKNKEVKYIFYFYLILFAGLELLFYYYWGEAGRFELPVIIAFAMFSAIVVFIYIKCRKTIIISYLGLFAIISIYILSVDYAFDNLLQTHHQHRIKEVLGQSHDPLGTGYNLNQSLIAIGSGGFSGKGFMQGPQTKYNFVPEQSTDFIFCTIGEEWGLIGTSSVMLIYFILITRIIFLAERQRSSFSRVYGYAVASILFFHVFINLGMTVGIVPVVGIPLPFLSYGGSSLWAFSILIFIFLKLDSDRLQVFR